jgi:hypothetical protein
MADYPQLESVIVEDVATDCQGMRGLGGGTVGIFLPWVSSIYPEDRRRSFALAFTKARPMVRVVILNSRAHSPCVLPALSI